MLSTIQDYPLTVTQIFEHGAKVFADSEVITAQSSGPRRATYAEVHDRSVRLAAALKRLGVASGDRVGSFAWNIQEHLEAYFAVPCMGAVLHTLNVRLFPDQLAYVINHGEDKVIIVDEALVEVLAEVASQLKSVEHFIVTGGGDGSALGVPTLSYEELLAVEKGFDWPEVDERAAAGMCYTSGTTGNPKGVAYSHRCNFVHAMSARAALAMDDHDKVLAVVPMFHANGWGLPYTAWMSGADFLLPNRFTQPEPLSRFIAEEKPTLAAAVPTVWNDMLRYGEDHDLDIGSIRMIVCGGAAVPLALMQRFEEEHGVPIIQAWGMTETGPLAALAFPPRGAPEDEKWTWRSKTGRIFAGVDIRIVDASGEPLDWDGESVGEIEVRGSWITGSYYKDDDPEKFHQGWLRTGDVGSIDPKGFIQITDRAKDVIKSGGEWISSVELEGLLMAHPAVAEAAVVGVPDDRWDERPLACVVVKPGSEVTIGDLRGFLEDKIAKWWMPERWAFIDEVPKTSVGKFDKKVLRAAYSEGKIRLDEQTG
jgi:fatty-acyl-CoA synthase